MISLRSRCCLGFLTAALSLSLAAPPSLAQSQAPAPELVAYAALRSAKLSGEVATVSNLAIRRDAGLFTLKSGELHFVSAVEGRVTGAVFVGDGEFTLAPPIECERRAVAIYAKAPEVAERFEELVLRFSDETWAEIKESGQAEFSTGGARADRAAKLLSDNDNLLRERLRMNLALRAFADVYSKEKERHGYFAAFIKGSRWSKLIFLLDPRGIGTVAPEQVMLASYGEADGGIWAAFPMGAAEGKPALSDARTFDITRHEIEAAIEGTKITATDRVTLKPVREGVRVLPFELFPKLRVSKVTDGSGNPLPFIQQKEDEDAELAVVLPEAPAVGVEMTLTVEYAGDEAVRQRGAGNFTLLPRSTWYPNNGSTAFGDRALFRTTFRVPKNNTIIGTGALAEPERQEGNVVVSTWTSGDVELAVAGFNYGNFKKKELRDPETGYTIEFYANKHVPDEIAGLQRQISEAEARGATTGMTLGAISTTGMADAAIADTQNATRIFNAYFGKLPYGRIAMSQQPADNYGQAWPTLVYMPYTAFLDSTIRMQLMGIRGGTSEFWEYVGPHEVAHQWWGHVVGWRSYRDQWMSEGFAEFSASLYVQHVRGTEPFVKFWEDHRKQITQAGPLTEGKAPYTIGPVTQGYRLSGAKTGAVYQFLVYPKGAYILHMLRMMMYTPQSGDAAFIAMMKDFIQTHFNGDVSTEDFKRAVEKHMTPAMDLGGNGRMDWFFDQWVYGTEMPKYAFEYAYRKEGGKTVLVGTLSQSNVSDAFRMNVPIYLDWGKGWTRLGTVALQGNASKEFKVPMQEKPKRTAANALNDVLCLEMRNAETK